jgi:hypothetical protein
MKASWLVITQVVPICGRNSQPWPKDTAWLSEASKDQLGRE